MAFSGAECHLCPHGTYSDAKGSASCRECPRGSISLKVKGGQTTIEDCKVCEEGSYSNSSSLGKVSCLECDEGYTTVNGTGNAENHDSKEDCKFADEGWWLDEDTKNLIMCANKEKSCKGHNECRQGYEKYLCGSCSEGYFKATNGDCKKCPEESFNWIPHAVILGSLFFVALIVSLNLCKIRTKMSGFFHRNTPKTIKIIFGVMKNHLLSIQSKGKIAFSFFQVVMLMGKVYSVEYPPEYVKFEKTWLDWLGLNIIMEIECYQEVSECITSKMSAASFHHYSSHTATNPSSKSR